MHIDYEHYSVRNQNDKPWGHKDHDNHEESMSNTDPWTPHLSVVKYHPFLYMAPSNKWWLVSNIPNKISMREKEKGAELTLVYHL